MGGFFVKAIILAAGYATRLYPLTLDKPKALLPINGVPIIDYIVNGLDKIENIDKIYVLSNDKFFGHFVEWANHPKIEIVNDNTTSDETKLGAIGGIDFLLKEKNIDDDVMIIAGDNFFTYELKDCYDFFVKMNKDLVCVKQFLNKDEIKRFGVAVLDSNDRIIDVQEKPQNPKSDIVMYATYIYKKDTLPLFKTYLEAGNKPDAPGYFIEWLHKIKDVYGFKIDGDCYDIGTLESYEAVKESYHD